MGCGIAHAFLVAGANVVVVDVDDRSASLARDRVKSIIRRSEERGTLREAADHVLRRLTVVASLCHLGTCDAVVEAVPEDLDLKRRIFDQVEERVSADAPIVTNTSSIPVSRIASGLRQPNRCLGMHFFNPVPSSMLIEIVTTVHTSEELVSSAVGWARSLGKTPIVVRDSPGFASSRLGVCVGLEAIRMLEEQVASAADIDAAMCLGYKHPMGPLRLTDLVGLDVRLGVARHLAETLGPRFEPPQLLVDLVSAGRLGRKAGRGFYEWSNG